MNYFTFYSKHDHHHHEPGMPFDFNYAVKDDYYGNDYSHNAVSDGDVTRGEYRILLPDGRTQIVRYTADWKNGFNAQVYYYGIFGLLQIIYAFFSVYGIIIKANNSSLSQ